MDYRLGIEQSEPGKWIAWVFGLPGCFSRGATRTEAVAAAPQAIADYFNWRDGYNRVGEDDIEQIRGEVTEVFENYETLDGYWVNSFFDHDRRLVSAADADDARWLLDCTRSDLVRTIQSVSPKRLDAAIPGERFQSLSGILRHVAGAELWYLNKLGLGFDRAELPDDLFRQLEKIRAHLVITLPQLVDNDTIRDVHGERWSARKVIRRALWHERVHTWHIGRLIAGD